MSAPDALLTVSICMCTFNRERLLRQTLAQLTRLAIPDDVSLEVVVVDNNSTDGTPEVLRAAAAELPLRAILERTPGIAAARNAAVSMARGELLLWTDDDVLVEPDWLARYVRASRQHPDAGFFGGPVRPRFEGAPPGWVRTILPEIRQAFALREFDPPIERVDLDHLPYGANFAARRRVHELIAFNTALGRIGKEGGCLSEESAFFEAAMEQGFTGIWIADCPVLHVIPPERQTTGYLRQYYRLAGATPSVYPPSTILAFGRPRWLWREWVQNEVAYRVFRHTTSPSRWFGHLKRAAFARGALFDRPRA